MTKATRKPRGRSTATIIKAAKAAGAESVTFPDGTVVKLAAVAPPAVPDDNEAERQRWSNVEA